MLKSTADDLSTWLKAIPDLVKHVSLFKERGMTGEQMLLIQSDAPLIELGIDSELDRKYCSLLVCRSAAMSCCRGFL